MPEKPRVLYIDDDPGLARLVARTLNARGFDVEHAASGEEGLAKLDEKGFAAVALDHHMPGHSGLDVLARIRARESPPPVIYVTGSEDSRVAVAALKAGAADYVFKDVAGHFRELLAEAVHAAMEGETLRRAKEEADREVREARDRAELMLQEVNHRVANSLSLVAALTRMQMSAVSDESAKAALKEMQARINAIAGVHRRLYTSQNVRAVEIDAYLKGLIEELEAAMRSGGRSHAIRLAAGSLLVPTDKAVSLGVIVTELVTNAYKYAYPEGVSGEILVEVAAHGENEARLAVEDQGVGWSGEGQAQGSGLGTRIVQAMARNLQSNVEFAARSCGTRAELVFPL
ncbi:MAG TPA: response regulator [Mesorhizobium sp.]|jgi:two-component sensor histidine kinase|nr:response regulator [Mesorhizobium sp.]